MSLFDNTKGIFEENVDATFKAFYKDFGLEKYPHKIIGSAGKKEVSGDIDIAVSKITADDADTKLRSFCADVKIQPGIGVVSCAYPIADDQKTVWAKKQSGETVQIDLMLTENIFLADFIYWAPVSKFSKYGGAQRSALLMAVAKAAHFTVIDSSWDIWLKRDITSTWTRYILDRHGLSLALQTNRAKDGKHLKKPVTKERMVVSTVPTTICEILLGTQDIGVTDSFEKLYSYMHTSSFGGFNKLEYIAKHAILMLHKGDFEIPKELTF